MALSLTISPTRSPASVLRARAGELTDVQYLCLPPDYYHSALESELVSLAVYFSIAAGSLFAGEPGACFDTDSDENGASRCRQLWSIGSCTATIAAFGYWTAFVFTLECVKIFSQEERGEKLMEMQASFAKTRFIGQLFFGTSCGFLLMSLAVRLCASTSFTFAMDEEIGSLGLYVTGPVAAICFLGAFFATAVLNAGTARVAPLQFLVNMQLFANPKLGGPPAILYGVLCKLVGAEVEDDVLERECQLLADRIAMIRRAPTRDSFPVNSEG